MSSRDNSSPIIDPALPRILSMNTVFEATPYSKSQIYNMIADGRFPQPIRLGPNKVGILESEFVDWVNSLVAARDAAMKQDAPGKEERPAEPPRARCGIG